MVDLRRKNIDWNIADADGSTPTWERVQVAVLMDIRDELRELNAIFKCKNFLEVPRILRGIRRHAARIPGGK